MSSKRAPPPLRCPLPYPTPPRRRHFARGAPRPSAAPRAGGRHFAAGPPPLTPGPAAPRPAELRDAAPGAPSSPPPRRGTPLARGGLCGSAGEVHGRVPAARRLSWVVHPAEHPGVVLAVLMSARSRYPGVFRVHDE